MRVTILGCGTAGGVPRIGNDWGDCDPEEPRNRRLRPSILVEEAGLRILVDTTPDLRQQSLNAGFDTLDAVLFTHSHADHTHGIDDLRYISRRMGGNRVNVFADARTLRLLHKRFHYAFNKDPDKQYPPILKAHEITGRFEIGPVKITPFVQDHGPISSIGYRFGPFAYSTDVVSLDDKAFEVLAGVEVWVVDTLQIEPHPTHSHLAQTLSWIERVKPRRAILHHMNTAMDYATITPTLPDGVELAYDGMVIEA